VLFLLLAGGFVFLIINSTGWHLASWPAVLSIFGVNELYLSKRKYKSYLPAMATVEGGGIKRGLTAPQAAVLLELPLGKVVSLVIFGLLKKRVLMQVSEDPLTVEVRKPFRFKKAETRRRVAGKEGIVLHDYEHPFIETLRDHTGPVENSDLSKAVGKLIESATNRMKGFDLDETREYYRRIVTRAWTEAKSVGEIKQRTEVVDRNFEWMMMDPQWTVVFDGWGRGGYNYRPTWNRGFPRPTSGGGGGTVSKPATAPSGQSTMGDVAASFSGWAENLSDKFVSTVEPGSMGLDVPKGVLDLSGIDRVTADVFEALTSDSGGGGGGGGGGCACACAGCACACACAGGGR